MLVCALCVVFGLHACKSTPTQNNTREPSSSVTTAAADSLEVDMPPDLGREVQDSGLDASDDSQDEYGPPRSTPMPAGTLDDYRALFIVMPELDGDETFGSVCLADEKSATIGSPLACWGNGSFHSVERCHHMRGVELTSAEGTRAMTRGEGYGCNHNYDYVAGVVLEGLSSEDAAASGLLGTSMEVHTRRPRCTNEETETRRTDVTFGTAMLSPLREVLPSGYETCLDAIEGKRAKDLDEDVLEESYVRLVGPIDDEPGHERLTGFHIERVGDIFCELSILLIERKGTWSIAAYNMKAAEVPGAFGWGEFLPAEAECFDLNLDERAEFLLPTGPETSREDSYVVYDASQGRIDLVGNVHFYGD